MERSDASTVTFRFISQEDKATFLGGLSDAWGENAVDIRWPNGTPLFEARTIDARPFPPGHEYGEDEAADAAEDEKHEAWIAQVAAWQAEDAQEGG